MDSSQMQDRERARESNIDLRPFEQRRRAFVREQAHEENNTFMRLLSESVEWRNAAISNGSKFVLKGNVVQLGNAALYITFDQLYANPDQFVLSLGIGLAPFKKPMFGSEPTPETHILGAAGNEDLSRVVWEWRGSRDRVSSARLVEFALNGLAAFASKHNLK
jgi:hypothetical protein